MGHQHRRGVPSLLCWHGRGVLCLRRHHSLHPLHVWPTAGNLQGPDHWSRCSSGKNVDFYIILQWKVMKEWVDMENFYRDSTRFHHEEAVWIISCWICFWLWVYTCIVIESIQISCYWPYRPSCFKYLMINLYLIQFLLKEVLIGTYIFVTRFLKTKHLLRFQGNGHERDFMDDKRVYIMDVYNRGIYPHDGYAKRNALICLYNVTSHI